MNHRCEKREGGEERGVAVKEHVECLSDPWAQLCPRPAGCCPRGCSVIPGAKTGAIYDTTSALPDEVPCCGMELMRLRVDFSLFDALG